VNCSHLSISLSFWVELVGACNSIFSFLRDSTCWISWIILVWLIASLCSTFVDTNLEIAAADGAPIADATEFRSLAGALWYLTFTRPNIAYAFNKSVSTCMILARLIWLGSSAFFATFRALLIWGFCYDRLHHLILWCTLMLIGLVVWIHTSPTRAMLCFLVTTSSPSPRSVRTPSLGQVLKPSIVQWLMELQRPLGCANSCSSFTLLFAVPPLFIVITSVLSTCFPILFSTSVPSTSRLISTLFGSKWLLVIYLSCMY